MTNAMEHTVAGEGMIRVSRDSCRTTAGPEIFSSATVVFTGKDLIRVRGKMVNPRKSAISVDLGAESQDSVLWHGA
jgi:hypothetical protein